MRQSMAPNRQSQLPGQVPSAALSAKLLEKKKECEAVIALEKASSKFLQRIEELGDDFDIVADAGKVHGQVLEQWPNMFRLLGLFLQSRQQQDGASTTMTEQPAEKLVRVPIEELQPSSKDES